MRAPFLLIALLAMAGCAQNGDGLHPRWYHDYQDYLTKGHYRAFAATFPSSRGLAAAYGATWYQPTVQDAVETALEQCKKAARELVRIGTCRPYAIGNISVVGMKREEIETVKEFYRLRPTASQDDYEVNKSERVPNG